MKTSMRRLTQYTAAAVFTAGILTLAAGPVDAQGNKKGPRASVASSTQCAIVTSDNRSDLMLKYNLGFGSALRAGDMLVATTLTNKGSGQVMAEVRPGTTIEAQHTPRDQKGNARFSLDVVSDFSPVTLPADVDPELVLIATFDLCDGTAVRGEVAAARALNALSTVHYGISGGTEASREVSNRCTDDPATPEDEGGIKVEDVLADITAACAGR